MKREGLKILSDRLTLDGKPFYLASGDMHYFRFFKDGWERRLNLMRDFGLTAVQTYVPWNLHEPEKGKFDFSGNLDIKAFLEACQKAGLYVLFRPSGYICSEWDFGGLPYWLKKDRTIAIRTSDEKFIAHLKDYYKKLTEIFVPYLYTNGGPIIAVGIENEYGSFSDDTEYLKIVGDILKDYGVDVPFYTANGWEPFKLKTGTLKDYWTALDLHALNKEAKESILSYQPDKPILIGEYWGGKSQQWGVPHENRSLDGIVKGYSDLINAGAYVNLYMFCGGTNFAFNNGALEVKQSTAMGSNDYKYIPFATSYDTSAPVTEHGEVTEKYFRLKKVLNDYLKQKGFPTNAKEEVVSTAKTQQIGKVKLTQSADFLANVENLTAKKVNSGKPLLMEDMDQGRGFILYSTYIKYTDNSRRMLKITGLHDRATVYVDGNYVGTFNRDGNDEPYVFNVNENGSRLDILVESLGSINYGVAMLNDYKGIQGYVRLELVEDDNSLYLWNYTLKSCWENRTIPLMDVSKVDYSIPAKKDCPAFYKGSFTATPGVDAFIETDGWRKGNVFVNGFNLGRYWEIGPQKTLYLPGELLKEENEIVVFEIHNPNADISVNVIDTPKLFEEIQSTIANSKVED